MGLFLAATIVQAYGGEIAIASSGPGGTTISIRLPLEISYGNKLKSKLPNILLVSNDEHFWQEIIETALSSTSSLSICNLSEIERLCKETCFNLIIFDTIVVTNLSGIVATIIERCPQTKIIIATAAPTWKEAREAFYVGVSDYIRKSNDPAEILLAVQKILQEPLKTPQKEVI